MLDYGSLPLKTSFNPSATPANTQTHCNKKRWTTSRATKSPRNSTHARMSVTIWRKRGLNKKPLTTRATSPRPCATVCIDNMADIDKCRNGNLRLDASLHHSTPQENEWRGCCTSAARQVQTSQHLKKTGHILCGIHTLAATTKMHSAKENIEHKLSFSRIS